MKHTQELIVITKTYDLILWSCNHNHAIGERIGIRLELDHLVVFPREN